MTQRHGWQHSLRVVGSGVVGWVFVAVAAAAAVAPMPASARVRMQTTTVVARVLTSPSSSSTTIAASAPTAVPTPVAPPTPTQAPSAQAPAGVPTVTVIAIAKNRLTPVFKTIDAKKPFATMDNRKNYSGAHVFTVIEKRGSMYYVNVAMRPNGTRGYVREADVTLYKHDYAITVDRASFTLTLYKNGAVMLTAPVAVGQDKWPTPAGSFFTREFVKSAKPNSPYGTGAFGLSGYSNVLTQFGRGDGQIAIHGTNQPELLGTKASHGCIRIPNDVLTMLQSDLPLGVPVIVT